MDLGRYLEVLRTPDVARLALFTTVGRLPFGILPFAVVLLMREESYGYGEIGAVLAASALAVGPTAAGSGTGRANGGCPAASARSSSRARSRSAPRRSRSQGPSS